MKRIALNRHPRWLLYRKLRRAIKSELEADFKACGIDREVSDDNVNDYMRAHIDSIARDLKSIFRRDLQASEARHAAQMSAMIREISDSSARVH